MIAGTAELIDGRVGVYFIVDFPCGDHAGTDDAARRRLFGAELEEWGSWRDLALTGLSEVIDEARMASDDCRRTNDEQTRALRIDRIERSPR